MKNKFKLTAKSILNAQFISKPCVPIAMPLSTPSEASHRISHCKLHVSLAYRQDSPLNQPLQIACLSCIQTRFPIEPAIANCMSLLHKDKIPHWTSHCKLHVSLAFRQDFPLPTTGYLFECNEEMQVKSHLSENSNLGPPESKRQVFSSLPWPNMENSALDGGRFHRLLKPDMQAKLSYQSSPSLACLCIFFCLLKEELALVITCAQRPVDCVKPLQFCYSCMTIPVQHSHSQPFFSPTWQVYLGAADISKEMLTDGLCREEYADSQIICVKFCNLR